jgi:hypothetical protein
MVGVLGHNDDVLQVSLAEFVPVTVEQDGPGGVGR